MEPPSSPPHGDVGPPASTLPTWSPLPPPQPPPPVGPLPLTTSPPPVVGPCPDQEDDDDDEEDDEEEVLACGRISPQLPVSKGAGGVGGGGAPGRHHPGRARGGRRRCRGDCGNGDSSGGGCPGVVRSAGCRRWRRRNAVIAVLLRCWRCAGACWTGRRWRLPVGSRRRRRWRRRRVDAPAAGTADRRFPWRHDWWPFGCSGP